MEVLTVWLWSLGALAAGFVIDTLVGDPHWLPHPVQAIGFLISKLEKLFRKLFPKSPRGELAGGFFLMLIVLLISAGIPFVILFFFWKFSPWLFFGLESVLCWQILAAHSLRKESLKVEKALVSGNLEDARFAVSMIVGRDTAGLDEAGVARAAVETVAENTSDGVIAPLLYMLLGGAVLGFFYKAANTMDSMIAYRDERYEYFGKCAARLDDALNYLPARISGLLLILSAFLIGYDGKNAWRIFRRDRRKHASPNSAQTEAACAGALGLQLAGNAVYHGVLHEKPYIGDSLREIEPKDIRRANRLMYAGTILGLVIFGGLEAALLLILL